MAKCVFCLDCGSIKSLPLDGTAAMCECPTGQVVGWWIDINSALAQVAVLPGGNRDKARILELHNGFLRAELETMPTGYVGPDGQLHPFEPQQVDANWRDMHAQVIMTPPRPESVTIFHPSRRACPLVVQRPGTSPDTHWATDVELQRRGLIATPEPAPA